MPRPELPIEGLDGRARSFGILSSSLRLRAVWPRSPLRWRPDCRRTTPRSAWCGSSTPADRPRQSDRVVGELVNGSRRSLAASQNR